MRLQRSPHRLNNTSVSAFVFLPPQPLYRRAAPLASEHELGRRKIPILAQPRRSLIRGVSFRGREVNRLGTSGLRMRVDSAEVGCASLVAGTMVGAGVLALPAVSAPAGFGPATITLVFVWAYMAASALLSAEVAVYSSCALGRPNGVSLLSQARLTLGPVGAGISSLSYIFLHYAVLTAYVSQGASVCNRIFPFLPNGTSGLVFLGSLAYALYAFNDEQVDAMNNLLFGGVVVSFGAVLSALIPNMHLEALTTSYHWRAVPRAVPTLLLSCVFHNIVGSVAARLGTMDRVRNVILVGSGVPLAMFVVCNAVVLAAASGTDGSTVASGVNPLVDLSARGGFSSIAIDAFSGLAVATSAIGFVEGLNQLWNDARISILGESSKEVSQNAIPSYMMSVLPPVFLANSFPNAFLSFLNVAGLYGVAVLFGVLPASMAWRQRYAIDTSLATASVPSLPGGRVGLMVMVLLPLILIGYNSLLMLDLVG